MLETSEREETNALKGKNYDLSKMHSIRNTRHDTLDYKIILCVASHEMKKLLDRVPMKCYLCLIRVTYGYSHALYNYVVNRILQGMLSIDT